MRDEMTKWTEGEWRVRLTPSDLDGYAEVYVLGNPNPLLMIYAPSISGLDATAIEALARLIAAAPDLYDALAWVRTCYRPDDQSDMVKTIDAALSRAQGSSNVG